MNGFVFARPFRPKPDEIDVRMTGQDCPDAFGLAREFSVSLFEAVAHCRKAARVERIDGVFHAA